MARVSSSQLDGAAAHLNGMLESRGSSARVDVSRRNGYVAVDLSDVSGHILRTLTVGTTSETYQFVRAMMEGLWLLEPPHISETRNRLGGDVFVPRVTARGDVS